MNFKVNAALMVMTLATIANGAPPTPVAFWNFQEGTGLPKVSKGKYQYELIDGDPRNPITRSTPGLFGPYSSQFVPVMSSPSQRLYASRESVPELTSAISGPSATVTVVAWVSDASNSSEQMVAGVWDENLAARQYAIFINLGACHECVPTH